MAVRISFTNDWGGSATSVLHSLRYYTPGHEYRWGELIAVEDPAAADYLVVLNGLPGSHGATAPGNVLRKAARKIKNLMNHRVARQNISRRDAVHQHPRKIYLQMEPDEIRLPAVDPSDYIYDGSYENHHHVSNWHVLKPFQELESLTVPETMKPVSAIVSGKTITAAQRRRIETVRRVSELLEARNSGRNTARDNVRSIDAGKGDISMIDAGNGDTGKGDVSMIDAGNGDTGKSDISMMDAGKTVGAISASAIRHEIIRDGMDVFGRGLDAAGFGSACKGPLEYNGHCKFRGLYGYRYSLAFENSRQANYFTEKLVDCFLCWVKPVYWGCPNILDYFPEESLTVVDIFDEHAPEKIVDELARPVNYDALREARELVMHRYNIWPSLSGIIEGVQEGIRGNKSKAVH